MHVVITGANRGIGLALTEAYLSLGHEVTALCRSSSKALNASAARVIEGVDVTSEDALPIMAKAFEGQTVDLLINNAGLLVADSLNNLPWQDIEAQFSVNTLGPLRITQALLDYLKTGSKVAIISSRMGSVADNGSGGYYGYRMSKAALNIAAKSLAIDLKPRGIAVAILHPGFVQTAMVNHAGDISAAEAAQGLIARINETTIDNSGAFVHANGESLPW